MDNITPPTNWSPRQKGLRSWLATFKLNEVRELSYKQSSVHSAAKGLGFTFTTKTEAGKTFIRRET